MIIFLHHHDRSSDSINLPLPGDEPLGVVIIASEEYVVLRVLCSGQHHVETLVEIILLVVEKDVRVAVNRSQYVGVEIPLGEIIYQGHLPLHVDPQILAETDRELNRGVLPEPR